MKRIAKMETSDRKEIFEYVAQNKYVHPSIIEKDFWMCYVLSYLFNESKYKDSFTFKGGTSLSKAYDVISRMSEDIDIILDYRLLGIPKDEPYQVRSIRQQIIYNGNLNNKAKEFIVSNLMEDLINGLNEIIDFKIVCDIDNQCINIYYPQSFVPENAGMLQCIKLEIGPIAAWEPNSIKIIKPYICDYFPNLDTKGIKVRTVSISRTFYEKITILHREANRRVHSSMPRRYARHYYDVYKIFNSSYFEDILKEVNLIKEVTRFKIKFYNDNWANYSDILKGEIKLLPPKYRLMELEKDYKSMQEMIYGCRISFDEMMKSLSKLEIILSERLKAFISVC